MDGVVIAAPSGSERRAEESLAAAAPRLDGRVVAGGASRADSVRIALAAVSGSLVLVHDAARPLAGPELFDAVVTRLEADPAVQGVIAAAPITDTVKRAGTEDRAAGRVLATERREQLWAAQTPQGFRTDALRSAQERAHAAGELAAATDEAGLIEAAGGTVLLEPAPRWNLKVTTAEDLRIAEALLAASGRV